MSQTQTSKPQEFVINLYDIETNPSDRYNSMRWHIDNRGKVEWHIDTHCDVYKKTETGLELIISRNEVNEEAGAGPSGWGSVSYRPNYSLAVQSYAAIDLVAQENSKTVTCELPTKKLPSNQVYKISCYAQGEIQEINHLYEQMDYVKTHTLEKCVEEVKALESKVFTCTLETSSEVEKQIHETYQKRRYVTKAMELYGYMKNYQAKLIADKAQVLAGGK